MAKVNICDVTVLDNPSPFKNPFQFEITFECLEDLKDGKLFYFVCNTILIEKPRIFIILIIMIMEPPVSHLSTWPVTCDKCQRLSMLR